MAFFYSRTLSKMIYIWWLSLLRCFLTETFHRTFVDDLIIYRSVGWVFLECLVFGICLVFFFIMIRLGMRHGDYRCKGLLTLFHVKIACCGHRSLLWTSITFDANSILGGNVTMRVCSPHQRSEELCFFLYM